MSRRRAALNGMDRARLLLLTALAAPLAACGIAGGGDGPSERDIADALSRAGMKVKSAERIACKPAPDRPGYVCDFKAETCGQFGGACNRSTTRTGRFVKFGDNWMFRDDVADPNRNLPPEPTPTPGPTLTPSPTPSTTPSATVIGYGEAPPPPGVTPTPLPAPSASKSPAAKPTPKPSVTPSPKPSPMPRPSPSASASPTSKKATGVNVGWLSGRWGTAAGDCDARRAVKFAPGGGFYGRHGIGSWKLKGRTITVTGRYSDGDKPFSQTLAVERIGEDSMTIEGKRYQRCTE
ncbi:MAG: hypothetical protein J0I47_10110 [Sphingomonas sp.]|uniref:hypothetical protein n=1 Tax=Sphingomonas sp. TaxID=28214 RepID=UPI001AC058C0|nr:hypothetical protein [Sphingomonas sp.]MBN8808568.1 hypothetical protein [Sphingomonas sp.]